MKRWLAAGMLLLTAPWALADTAPEIKPGDVVVAPLKGEVSEAQFFVLRRALKAAEAGKASAFVIDMDTYGGSLGAAVKILDLLLKSSVPTYTYIDSNAGSAGALIALGTKHIYMAPVSAIGAAAPVSGGGQEIGKTMSAKIISYFSGYFRSAAEKNGYNPDLAEAFINKEKEVKIGNQVISAKDSLLTLSAQEAVKKYNGKPLLASGTADSIPDLVKQAGLAAAPVVEFEPSGFERLALWVTVLAPLFLAAGGLLAYLEFKSPGFGVAGVLSAVCFLLFFAGHYIAGLTGFEVMAVFVLGVVLVIVEFIFFPGIVVLSALGLALMLGSVFFAMVDIWPTRPLEFKIEIFSRAMIQLSAALVLTVIGGALLARFFPSLPFFRRFMLSAATPGGVSIPVPEATLDRRPPGLGESGTAISPLRPSGRAEFSGAQWDVVSDGEFINPGEAVIVERREMAQIHVRRKR